MYIANVTMHTRKERRPPLIVYARDGMALMDALFDLLIASQNGDLLSWTVTTRVASDVEERSVGLEDDWGCREP